MSSHSVFLEEKDISHLGKKVETPDGWSLVTHVGKTEPLHVVLLRTKSYTLRCARKHFVRTAYNSFVYAADLTTKDWIMTRNGSERVLEVAELPDKVELYDIRVENKSHTYYADGISSHNSTGLGAAGISRCNIIPRTKLLYIAPHFDQVKTFADRLREMERNCSIPIIPGGKNNQTFKEYLHTESSMKLMHVLTDATPVRGNTVTDLFLDECLPSYVHIACTGDSKKSVDKIESGDSVQAHDENGNLVTDKVVRKVAKGKRHCWRITLVDGTQLTCTSNERIRTTAGWIYMSQLLSEEEASICDRAMQVHESEDATICVHAGDLSDVLVLTHHTPSAEFAKSVGDLVPVPVDSVTYVGMEEVFDIETEKYHTFFAGGIAVHNCQDFDADLEPELLQTMKAAKRPSRLYCGTSTTRDTMLESKYQSSSRGVWFVRGGNGKPFALDDPDILEGVIKAEGMTCPHTGILIDPTDGEFLHEDRDLERIGRLGFHTPQLIVPEYATGDKWLEIYTDFIEYGRPKFLKEVMGIPVDDGNREITEGDLKRMAQEGVSLKKLQLQILDGSMRSKYRYIISGCDWGGSDYNPGLRTKVSYTVHVMMGVRNDLRLEVFYYKRYAGMDYSMIAKDIIDNHVRFGGDFIGSDIGMGMYYNKALQSDGRIPAHRHVMWNYSQGNFLMKNIATDGASIYHLALNKTDSLSALFGDFKREDRQGGPRVITPKWSDVQGYMEDCTNSFRHIKEVGARTSVTYKRHGSKADDILHGINFAACTARLVLGEPLIGDDAFVQGMQRNMGVASRPKAATLGNALKGGGMGGGHMTL